MKHLIISILALALTVPAVAQAQKRLSSQEQQHTRMASLRGRLEARLADQASRIRRLKTQPTGVRRDYQLNSALRTTRALSVRLSKLQRQLNGMTRALVRSYDGAIARATVPARRAEFQRRKARLLVRLQGRAAAGGKVKIAAGERANELDSSDDLLEKADLLEDSAVKVRRQLVRIQRQLVRLKLRARLRRHGRALDSSPFDESSPGRTSRARKPAAATDTTKSGGAPAAKKDPQQSSGGGWTYNDRRGDDHSYNSPPGSLTGNQPGTGSSPPPAPPKGGTPTPSGAGKKTTNGGSRDGEAGGGSAGLSSPNAPAVTLKGIVDPSVLKELKRTGKGGSVQARIKALELATKRLKQVDRDLSTRAGKLRQRAKSLHGKK